MKRVGNVFAGVVSPPVCFGCRRFASFESRFPLCAACESRWALHTGPAISIGRLPVYFAMPYRGIGRKLIQRFKIEEADYLAPLLRHAIGRAVTGAQPDLGAYDALVPIPSHNSSFFKSWTSAARIAEILSELTRLPVRALLKRARPIRKQSLLGKSERRANVERAFEAVSGGRVSGGSFLLVDDVVTTGYTAEACAEALRARGAAAVGLFAAARGELAGEVAA